MLAAVLVICTPVFRPVLRHNPHGSRDAGLLMRVWNKPCKWEPWHRLAQEVDDCGKFLLQNNYPVSGSCHVSPAKGAA